MLRYAEPGINDEVVEHCISEPVAIQMQRQIGKSVKGFDPYKTDLRALQDFESVHWATQENPVVASNGQFYKLTDTEGKVSASEIEQQVGCRIWCKTLKNRADRRTAKETTKGT